MRGLHLTLLVPHCLTKLCSFPVLSMVSRFVQTRSERQELNRVISLAVMLTRTMFNRYSYLLEPPLWPNINK